VRVFTAVAAFAYGQAINSPATTSKEDLNPHSRYALGVRDCGLEVVNLAEVHPGVGEDAERTAAFHDIVGFPESLDIAEGYLQRRRSAQMVVPASSMTTIYLVFAREPRESEMSSLLRDVRAFESYQKR